jgi:hypothetical protein
MDGQDLFTGSSEVRRMAARPAARLAASGGGPMVYGCVEAVDKVQGTAVISWVSSAASFGSCSIGEERLELRVVGKLWRARMAPVVLLLVGEKGQDEEEKHGYQSGKSERGSGVQYLGFVLDSDLRWRWH